MQEPFSTTALEEALDADGAREVLESFLEDTTGVVDRIAESVTGRSQETLHPPRYAERMLPSFRCR